MPHHGNPNDAAELAAQARQLARLAAALIGDAHLSGLQAPPCVEDALACLTGWAVTLDGQR